MPLKHYRDEDNFWLLFTRKRIYVASIYIVTTILLQLECKMIDKVTIKIPRELYEKLREMIEDTGFSSVTEFIVFVMRNLASSGKIKEEDKLTEEEVKAVRERLRRLGYL